jgi:hypothetical protein
MLHDSRNCADDLLDFLGKCLTQGQNEGFPAQKGRTLVLLTHKMSGKQ